MTPEISDATDPQKCHPVVDGSDLGKFLFTIQPSTLSQMKSRRELDEVEGPVYGIYDPRNDQFGLKSSRN
jgi:hypothetical protein